MNAASDAARPPTLAPTTTVSPARLTLHAPPATRGRRTRTLRKGIPRKRTASDVIFTLILKNWHGSSDSRCNVVRKHRRAQKGQMAEWRWINERNEILTYNVTREGLVPFPTRACRYTILCSTSSSIGSFWGSI